MSSRLMIEYDLELKVAAASTRGRKVAS